MINMTITDKSERELFAEIQAKIDGAKELTSVRAKRQYMKAAFSMSALKFVSETNALARSAKKEFHHVYEWGMSGKESGRLFRILKQQGNSGSATIYYRFNNSKKNSPVNRILRVPGPTGKTVKVTGIFKKKAEVMESGKPVSFITRRTIALPSGSGISFVPAGKQINIKNPGGNTRGQFEKHFRLWWAANFPTVLDRSGVLQKVEINVARALNRKSAGRQAAIDAVERTTSQFINVGSVV